MVSCRLSLSFGLAARTGLAGQLCPPPSRGPSALLRTAVRPPFLAAAVPPKTMRPDTATVPSLPFVVAPPFPTPNEWSALSVAAIATATDLSVRSPVRSPTALQSGVLTVIRHVGDCPVLPRQARNWQSSPSKGSTFQTTALLAEKQSSIAQRFFYFLDK